MSPQVTIIDHTVRLDRAAAQQAVDLLGITRPITIQTMHFRTRGGGLGQWLPEGEAHRIELAVNHEWDRPGEPDFRNTLRYTVWHELGHAQDYDHRATKSGAAMFELSKFDAETYYYPVTSTMVFAWDRDRYLTEIPMERYADEVALAHMDELDLTLPAKPPEPIKYELRAGSVDLESSTLRFEDLVKPYDKIAGLR